MVRSRFFFWSYLTTTLHSFTPNLGASIWVLCFRLKDFEDQTSRGPGRLRIKRIVWGPNADQKTLFGTHKLWCKVSAPVCVEIMALLTSTCLNKQRFSTPSAILPMASKGFSGPKDFEGHQMRRKDPRTRSFGSQKNLLVPCRKRRITKLSIPCNVASLFVFEPRISFNAKQRQLSTRAELFEG